MACIVVYGGIHTCDLLGVNYCMYDSHNYGLYCNVWGIHTCDLLGVNYCVYDLHNYGLHCCVWDIHTCDFVNDCVKLKVQEWVVYPFLHDF